MACHLAEIAEVLAHLLRKSSDRQPSVSAIQNDAKPAAAPTKMPRPLNQPAIAPIVATIPNSAPASRSSLVHRLLRHAIVMPTLQRTSADVGLLCLMRGTKSACEGCWATAKGQSRRGGGGQLLVVTI